MTLFNALPANVRRYQTLILLKIIVLEFSRVGPACAYVEPHKLSCHGFLVMVLIISIVRAGCK